MYRHVPDFASTRSPSTRSFLKRQSTNWFLLALMFSMGAIYISPVCAQETAEFKVVFESTWSAATHPFEFPGNPHFSGLIGTTHNADVSFWAVGQAASSGIKSMAETGSKSSIRSIFNDSDDAGTSDFRISEGGIGTSPGSVSATFSATESHPLLTLVSMLAPSPDWFVGVAGLLLRSSGGWIVSQEVDLYTYDAGTDSGTSYSSSNSPSNPADVITRLEDSHMVIGGNVRKVGRFIVTLEGVTGTKTEPDEEPKTFATNSFPNPFSETLTLEIKSPNTRHAQLEAFDVLGRKVDTIYSGMLYEGMNRLHWDASAALPGAYWVRLQSPTGQQHFPVMKSH